MLSLIIFIPLLGAVAVLVLPKNKEEFCKWTAFYASVVSLALCGILLLRFPYGKPGFQFRELIAWIPAVGVDYRLGIDGLSLLLVILTALLTPISILASFSSIQTKVREFYFFLLVLETGMLGTFLALDLFLFFVFWELMLVPMYFIIGVWGGKDRIYAGIKFFLFTATGSALMLIVIFYLYFEAERQFGSRPSFNFENFAALVLSPNLQKWLFIGFVLAFLIKMPLFPFHTWLPYAHTEAPTAGSVILAGILLKTGVYGFLRFAVPLFPAAVVAFSPWIMALSIIGVIYGAMVAAIQQDVKRLVAYSSVSHIGMLMAGILAWNLQGVEGGILQMINHGLSTGALFLIVGMIYERRHTRMISQFGGLAKVMPLYATFFMIFTLSSIGLPGLNGFVGEFLILAGLMGSSIVWTILAATGVILSAVYMLWLYQRMMFGPIRVEENQKLDDISRREYWTLAPLAVLCFLIGFFPYPIQKAIEPAAIQIVKSVKPYLTTPTWHEKLSQQVEAVDDITHSK